MLSVAISRSLLTFHFLKIGPLLVFLFFDLVFPDKNKTLRKKSNFLANIIVGFYQNVEKVVFETHFNTYAQLFNVIVFQK